MRPIIFIFLLAVELQSLIGDMDFHVCCSKLMHSGGIIMKSSKFAVWQMNLALENHSSDLPSMIAMSLGSYAGDRKGAMVNDE